MRFLRETSGAAALELAIWAGVLIVPILNVIDVGLYLFQRVQVENAAQIAAQATWKACDDSSEQRPVTTKCLPNGGSLGAYLTSIVQTSTSLTTAITVAAPTVKYYCLDNSNALVAVATAPTAPAASCAAVRTTAPVPKPGEYVEVTTSYAYSPMFGGISVAGMFATPITYTARARID